MFSKLHWFICGTEITNRVDNEPKDPGLLTQEKDGFEEVDYPVFDRFCRGLNGGVKMGKSTMLKHGSFLFAFTELRKEKFLFIGMRRAVLPGNPSDPDKLQWSPIMNIEVNSGEGYEVSTTSFVNSSKSKKMFIFVSLVKRQISDSCIQWKVICASSSDCGSTWSEWKDLTAVIKQMRPVGSKYFTVSPGHGVEIQNGSLIVFGRFYKSYDSFILNKNFKIPDEDLKNEFDFENDISCSFFLTSHDFGENWVLQNGPKSFVYATIEDKLLQMNDCNIVEYKSDCLFFLATAKIGDENILVSSRSFNAGRNWDRAVPLIRNKPDRPEILTKVSCICSFLTYILKLFLESCCLRHISQNSCIYIHSYDQTNEFIAYPEVYPCRTFLGMRRYFSAIVLNALNFLAKRR